MQNAPGGADQNVVGALRLRGALNREALQGALQVVMERHDALRTRFAFAADGSLEQVRPLSRMQPPVTVWCPILQPQVEWQEFVQSSADTQQRVWGDAQEPWQCCLHK